jgi:hypothetical protein
LHCNGVGEYPDHLQPLTCQGASLGCSVQKSSGCYGVLKADTGTCDCKTGVFKDVAKYTISGTVKGLVLDDPTHTLQIDAVSVLGAPSGTSLPPTQSTQAVTVTKDGAFTFPLPLAQAQDFTVSISYNPPNMACKVSL